MWKQLKHPLIDEWIDKMQCNRTMVYYSDLKRKEIVGTSLAVQWLRFCSSSSGGALVRFLVWELRSHMLGSVARNKEGGTEGNYDTGYNTDEPGRHYAE